VLGLPPSTEGDFTATLPPDTEVATFLVRRVQAGQAVTVPFVVYDACGGWETFVGGGAHAF
jgi:hypothetical protein